MVIDEIQLMPELFRPIKVAVDLNPTPGRFLLTGSSRIFTAFVDTGVACHLIGQDAARLGEPGGSAGPMMENLVAMSSPGN